MISLRPLTNSARFRHLLSTVYASATFSGSREFHPFSAFRTFAAAVSRVNGGIKICGGCGCVLIFAPLFLGLPGDLRYMIFLACSSGHSSWAWSACEFLPDQMDCAVQGCGGRDQK